MKEKCALHEGMMEVIYNQGAERDKDEETRKEGSQRC
jgi:hypothetical protein